MESVLTNSEDGTRDAKKRRQKPVERSQLGSPNCEPVPTERKQRR